MLEALHFIRPWWLLGLIPIIALAVLWARRRADGSHWEAQVAPELLAVLLEASGSSGARRKIWAVALTLGIATLGLAGPTWERLPQPVTQKTDATVIVLDLSLSMFAQDVAPSRLIRARQKITDILRLRQEGVTGLVTYAGDAHIVSPLTDDTRTISNLLNALSPEMMPVLGSNVRSALVQTHELFANSGLQQGRIVLITDGISRPSEVARFGNPNFPISILGIGTAAGAPIPLDFANQAGQVLTDQQGQIIVAQLNESSLAALVETTFGRYRTLGLQDADILELIATPLPSAEETSELEREFDTWADMGYWACICLLPLALLGFRRGVLACLCLLLLPIPASAGLWEDLWQRRDQQGYAALREERAQEAADLFADPQWRASAQYRNEEFPAAAAGFSGDRTTTGFYNLGNALARQGEFEQAIAAYAEVLSEDPAHQDAAFNKALVERLLADQEASEGQGQQQNQENSDSQGERQDSENSEPADSQQPYDDDTDPDSQDPAEASEDEEGQSEESPEQQPQDQVAQSRDEQQDALEQWLRRVPDDPGGLLRRKFRYETNQRLRRGDYQERRQEQIW